MKLHIACVVMAIASHAFASPPTDEEVARAAAGYNERIKQMQADGSFNPSKLGAVADESLAAIDISEMTLSQVETITGTSLYHYTSKANQFEERLGVLSSAATLEGARASIMRLAFLGSADAKTQQVVISAMLDHPKAAEALRTPELWRHFRVFGLAVHRDAIKGLTPKLVALGSAMPETLSVKDAALAAPALLDAVIAAGASPAEREPLRARVVTVLRSARERFDPEDPALKNISFGGPDAGQYLAQEIRRLEGPAVRGSLVGGPAPDLSFEWSSSARPISSLADLKGKVVVLDFWATWCGPCVASFPKMRETAARYKGREVEIIGVTSLQGSHNELNGTRIDCKGDPDRERSLMGAYVAANDINWTIAFSSQPVFNPDYGVRSIPAVFVIDQKGVLRHAGLSFRDNVKLHAAIDALLLEGGTPSP